MRGVLDANWLRVAGYLVAATAACCSGVRELHRSRTNRNRWPSFWFLTAALLLIMAIGRMADVGGWIAELGRREAVDAGWYTHRRRYQALVVGSVAAFWCVIVLVALWRVPERRRRYLPAAVVAFSLICYAGIRLVSLHQVDAVLYRRGVHGVRYDAVFELIGVAVAIIVCAWPLRPSGGRGASPAPSTEHDEPPAVTGPVPSGGRG